MVMVTSRFLFVVEDWWGACVTVWNKSWAFRQKNSICRTFGTNSSLGLMLIGLLLLSSWVSDTNQRPGLICSIMKYGLEWPCWWHSATLWPAVDFSIVHFPYVSWMGQIFQALGFHAPFCEFCLLFTDSSIDHQMFLRPSSPKEESVI